MPSPALISAFILICQAACLSYWRCPNLARLFLVIAAVFALAGCTQMDAYERTYAVTYQDGDATISGSVTLKPAKAKASKNVIPLQPR